MKRFLIISYWIVSILLVAVVLTSLGYGFLEALFIGSMFLPGALAAKYFFPKVKGVKDTVFLILGILAGEMLLFLVAHFSIITFRGNLPGPVMEWPDIPHILTNPVFIAIILTALAAGSYFFESWLDWKRPTKPVPITFTSDRKPVTLPLEEIPEQDPHLPVGSHPQSPFPPDPSVLPRQQGGNHSCRRRPSLCR